MNNSKTIYRKEIKYVVFRRDFLRIAKHLDALMQPDANGVDGYMVRSMYFDSITDASLQDNLAGLMEKQKIRLRIYNTDTDRVKLEYKCKSGTDGVKYSVTLSKAEALQMEQGDYTFLLSRPEPLANQLGVKMLRGCYSPKTIVEYQRKAYTYPASDVRITFDHHIKCAAVPTGLFRDDHSYIPLIEGDMGVLEVKYNDFLPSALKQVMQSVNRLPQASSKYSSARTYF